jgi:pimeloyl-ACP methyl ester carboxylesterase
MLAYDIDGSGGLVVMLHGLGGTATTFEPLASALAPEWRVVRPELPGIGRSAESRFVGFDEVLTAVLELFDRHEVRRAHCIGHSMGTVLCQLLAVRAPERVSSLTLLSPIRALTEAVRGALRERASRVRTEGMAPFTAGYIASALAPRTHAEHPVAVAHLRESMLRQPPHAYAAYCEALADYSAVDLARITAPTLLVAGTEDPVSTRHVVQELSTGISGAATEWIDGCGHWPTIERHADTAALVSAFLARQGRHA